MMYYIMYNGQQMGPMPAEQLRNYGLNPQSMVWGEGMPNWVAASTVPELAAMMNGTQQPYGPQIQQPAYGATMPLGNRGMQPMVQPVDNHMAMAIIATVVSFLFSCIGVIFGILAIVKANQVNTYVAQGLDDAARQASDSAKKNCYWAFGFAAVGFIGTIVLYWDAF